VPDRTDPSQSERGITRKQLLRAAGAGLATLGSAGLLSACGATSSTSFSNAAAIAGPPRRGGNLIVGLSGGTSADSLNPLGSVTMTDFGRTYQLFDELISFDSTFKPQLALAEEVTPNRDATEWTIRVRPDVTFHDGKPLTADDVIYTLRRIHNPKSPGAGASAILSVDSKNLRKLDKLTVRVPCKAPFSTFRDTLPAYNYRIVPVGFDPLKPVGTGPFRFESFTPGEQSVFTRNPEYWREGLPHVDQVTIVDYPDETSLINALISGQADLIAPLSPVSVGFLQAGGGIARVYPSGEWLPFTMRVDQPPFDDVRVRQAMRLIVDRHQMRDVVFSGHGALGNDIFSLGDVDYDTAIPQREQDIPRAKSLLKAAGRADDTFELVTSPIAQGTVNAAQVLAQQATSAGVRVNLRQITTTEFFGPGYLKWGFSQDFWNGNPYYPQVAICTVPTAPYNETHFADRRYQRLYHEGLATVDPVKRKAIARELQLIDHEQGGYIIPFFAPGVDGYSTKVGGIVPVTLGSGLPFNTFDLKHLWLT
jgi:peptide/nickel transport system substrate-binding protein